MACGKWGKVSGRGVEGGEGVAERRLGGGMAGKSGEWWVRRRET